jgi:quercetin dioxygenase-like cupin family protein
VRLSVFCCKIGVDSRNRAIIKDRAWITSSVADEKLSSNFRLAQEEMWDKLIQGVTIMQPRTIRVNASEETIKIGPLGIRFLLTGDDSSGSVSVFEVLVPVGQKLTAPAHKNDAYEEILYGIEGVLTWTVDGTPIEVGPGQALCIPRGAVHRFDNLGNEDVKQLAVISPAIMGPAYFREAAGVIDAAGGGPSDRAKMIEVFRRHGMTVAAPPAR